MLFLLRLVRFAAYWFPAFVVGCVVYANNSSVDAPIEVSVYEAEAVAYEDETVAYEDCEVHANNSSLDALAFIMSSLLGLSLTLFDLVYSKRKQAKARMYANMIRDGVRRVDDIAAATGLRYDVVKKDLRKLAKKGKDIFLGAYFNEATQEICLASPAAPAARWNNAPANAPATWNNAPANAPAQPAAPRNVVCSACGASVALVGDKRVCEYCGSPLN